MRRWPLQVQTFEMPPSQTTGDTIVTAKVQTTLPAIPEIEIQVNAIAHSGPTAVPSALSLQVLRRKSIDGFVGKFAVLSRARRLTVRLAASLRQAMPGADCS